MSLVLSFHMYYSIVVDCGPLPDISLGGVKLLNGSTVYASVAEYQCVTGYLLANGDERRECLSTGLWSGRAPVCLSEGDRVLKLHNYNLHCTIFSHAECTNSILINT